MIHDLVRRWVLSKGAHFIGLFQLRVFISPTRVIKEDYWIDECIGTCLNPPWLPLKLCSFDVFIDPASTLKPILSVRTDDPFLSLQQFAACAMQSVSSCCTKPRSPNIGRCEGEASMLCSLQQVDSLVYDHVSSAWTAYRYNASRSV